MKQVIHSLKDIESVPSNPTVVDKTNTLGAESGKAYHAVLGSSNNEKVTPMKAKNINLGSPSKQLAANMISVKGSQNLSVSIPSIDKNNISNLNGVSSTDRGGQVTPLYGNQKRVIKPVLKEPNSPSKKKIKSVLKNSPTKQGNLGDGNVKSSLRDSARDTKLSGLKGFNGTRTVSFDVDQ